MSDPIQLKFTPNPVQEQFILSRAEADLFSSRKGEGKSAALCWACFYHTRNNPGAPWLFIRDTFENIRRTTLAEFLHWFPDPIFGTWKPSEKTYTWNTQRTGMRGTVTFLGLDDDASAGRIASMPLAGVAIDEPSGAAAEGSQGVSEFVFDTAVAQLRYPGMRWYAVKLAQNNPDEDHWTYRRFVDPGTPPDPSIDRLVEQERGYKTWQTRKPENKQNLPPGYYEALAQQWSHRPDLVRRFVEGKYGFQQKGRPVTPEWNDELHLATGLKPVRGVDLWIGYDGGLTPAALITQVTPLGDWLILEAFQGEDMGMYELIRDVLKPVLTSRYDGFRFRHTGDPNLQMREQSSKGQSASRVITKELGGGFHPGPITVEGRVDPLREVLRRTRQGRGMVLVDKDRARPVWYSLRGGWHWHITRGGNAGNIAKDKYSHIGDATGYVAAKLFPLGKLKGSGPTRQPAPKKASYFDRIQPGTSVGMQKKTTTVLPKQAHQIGKGDA